MTCSWIGTGTPIANLFMSQCSLSGHLRSALVANVPHMHISTTTPAVVWGPPVVWRYTRINHSSYGVGVIPGINHSSSGMGVIQVSTTPVVWGLYQVSTTPPVEWGLYQLHVSTTPPVVWGLQWVWDETCLWGFVAMQIKYGCHVHSSP